MTEQEWADLVRHCPTLFHMAECGAWPSIQRHGLLSTSALLDRHGVTGGTRDAIERQHRPHKVVLAHGVSVRDQRPMSVSGLERCLTDMTPSEWFALLNGKVFFWLARRRLETLLNAKLNRDLTHDVLEIDTAALAAKHRAGITLSPINSGSTFALGPTKRGSQTFQPIDTFDYASRRKRHAPAKCAVELAVARQVPDVAELTSRVVRMHGATVISTLWERQKPVNDQSSAGTIVSR